MVRSVARLRAAGWDPLFLAVYDEAWVMARRLERIIGHTTGGNRLTMDFLAWWVDPREGQAGFSPHRDRWVRHAGPSPYVPTYGFDSACGHDTAKALDFLWFRFS